MIKIKFQIMKFKVNFHHFIKAKYTFLQMKNLSPFHHNSISIKTFINRWLFKVYNLCIHFHSFNQATQCFHISFHLLRHFFYHKPSSSYPSLAWLTLTQLSLLLYLHVRLISLSFSHSCSLTNHRKRTSDEEKTKKK